MSGDSVKVDAFRLKARVYTLAVMELADVNLEAIRRSLQSVYQQAPKMFAATPIVLDVAELKGASFDLKGVCEVMREFHMVPVAIQGTSVNQRNSAKACGLAIISSSQHKEASDIQSLQVSTPQPDAEVAIEEATAQAAEESETVESSDTHLPLSTHGAKVITTPVRSGQQIYAKGADLIVLSSVGQGAELLADGHIHVYGSLRGRALAGINGNEEARIFCSQLDAELLSIAGCYIMPDKSSQDVTGAKQVYLKEGHLEIVAI